MHKHTHCVLKITHRQLGRAEEERKAPTGALRVPPLSPPHQRAREGGSAAGWPTLIQTSSSTRCPSADTGPQ